ncbi:protein kinase domain-containing protein [Peptostreptococcus faecalis]|uniref:protein kinase domain-containing protein n=1 Tax=Peptostreptococcus faecalis TaxID=2045015 RepID=UPI000C7995E0|nr:protein kinase [Peptostreptococcus faecalis]
MLTQQTFHKILNYLDKQYWSGKTDETNWNYYGLVFDYHFDSSILSVDYLDINDFFDLNGSFTFVEDKYLSEQYADLPETKYLLLIQNMLNILHHSKIDIEQNEHIITTLINVLKRENVKVVIPDMGDIIVMPDDILDSGSYCNIVRMQDGLLRKELKAVYKEDEKLQKRMKYEFENMQKLTGCPQILNVFDFDNEGHSYLMEQADMNLAAYLTSEIELSFDEKIKIIMDILKGMDYAHKNSIIHRDLHLGNILKIGNDFVICDFGLSKHTSLIRSMKTSYTEKNNHIFVDPLAVNDFRNLDHKSDIYSVGKMIDYILTYNAANSNHALKTIVERCICRDKALRYDSIEQILVDIEIALKHQDKEQDISDTINKILNSQYDTKVHEYIVDLVQSDKLCKFIVTHRLSNFWELVLHFESVYQLKILQSISGGYSEATGYGGWGNYDIFASIAYNLCLTLEDLQPKQIAHQILEECAGIRYQAKNLLDRLPD